MTVRWTATAKVRSTTNSNVWLGKFRSVWAADIEAAERKIRAGFIAEGRLPDVRDLVIKAAAGGRPHNYRNGK